MRRFILCLLAAGVLVLVSFLGLWTYSQNIPEPLRKALLIPFAPGYGLAYLTSEAGIGERNYSGASVAFVLGNTLVWAAILYLLIELRLRRRRAQED